MRVNFEKVRYKNVLATGAMWIEVDLNRSSSTMIIGANGSGKSTVLEAIFFAGWGKAYRGINLDQLVNLKNQKELLVELYFTSGSKEVIVRRGISPDIFEIYVDDELQPVPSSKKLYQKLLNQLIGIDRDTAAQIIFVSKTQHLPFMRLDAAKRRLFVENILNLTIFQQMVKVKDARVGKNRSKISDLKLAWEGARDKAKVRQRYVDDLIKLDSDNSKRVQDESQTKVDQGKSRIDELNSEIEKLTLTYPTQELKKSSSDRERMRQKVSDISAGIRQTQREIDSHTDTCSACGQMLPDDHASFLDSKREEIEISKERLVSFQSDFEALSKEVERLESLRQESVDAKAKKKSYESEISKLEIEIDQILKASSKIRDMAPEIEKIKLEVTELQEIADKLKDRLHREVDLEKQLKIISMVLSDKGLKAAIIARMIPVLNRLVNENLSTLGLFATFKLDENFNETIRYLGFETMSYHSFSEGEKLRLDMAMLLAWRQIAQMNGAFSTNLLFFDEVFDSSLDIDGASALTDVLEQVDGLNVFVVTHTPEKIADRVRDILKFKKIDGYSRMVLNV